MMNLFSLSILIYSLSLFGGQGVSADSGPKPIVIWIQQNPGSMVSGQENPRLAIYESGLVIYSVLNEKLFFEYSFVILERKEIEKILDEINSFGDFSEWDDYYDIAKFVISHATTTILYLNLKNKIYTATVRGLSLDSEFDSTILSRSVVVGEVANDNLPNSLKELCEYLGNFEIKDPKVWIPEYLEVKVWPYEYAPKKSIIWPEIWPDINSPNSKKIGDSYLIYLPGEYKMELDKLLAKRKPRGAIEINGKKWAIKYRFVFPNEIIWQLS